MLWRKLSWGAFWMLCTFVLLLKVLAFVGKGWLLLRHLSDWGPHALAVALIVVIAVALIHLGIRKIRRPAPG